MFTSDYEKMMKEFERMKKWLYNSGYSKFVIDKAYHDARLQGPGYDPKTKKKVIPFVTLHCNNYTSRSVVKKANMLLENCPDADTREFFQQTTIVQALKQPPNILRQLTSAKFNSHERTKKPAGIYKCNDKRCKICTLYLVECESFKVANGRIWKVPTHITCQSKMVNYFQICASCNEVSNVGKPGRTR